MNKLCNLLKLQNEDLLFDKITQSFKEKITKWDYFVNWAKVFSNIEPIEKELNLLNYLIGKEDIEMEAYNLIKQYPQVVKAFPTLIAVREKSIDILIGILFRGNPYIETTSVFNRSLAISCSFALGLRASKPSSQN